MGLIDPAGINMRGRIRHAISGLDDFVEICRPEPVLPEQEFNLLSGFSIGLAVVEAGAQALGQRLSHFLECS